MNDLHSHGAFAGLRPATTCILTLIAEESWKTENRYRVPPPACFSLEETRKERFLCTLIIWGMFCGLLLEKGQVVVPDFGRMSFPG